MIYYTIPLNSLRHLMELCILCGTTFVQEMYLNEKMKHFTSQIIHTTSRCKIQILWIKIIIIHVSFQKHSPDCLYDLLFFIQGWHLKSKLFVHYFSISVLIRLSFTSLYTYGIMLCSTEFANNNTDFLVWLKR